MSFDHPANKNYSTYYRRLGSTNALTLGISWIIGSNYHAGFTFLCASQGCQYPEQQPGPSGRYNKNGVDEMIFQCDRHCTFAIAMCLALAATSAAAADDVKGSVTLTYSAMQSDMNAPGYMRSIGQMPRAFSNDGDYYGAIAELNFGKLSFGLDYTKGTGDIPEGGLVYGPTFNSLSGEATKRTILTVGYNVMDSATLGKLYGTLGYSELWSKSNPMIGMKNWFTGVELGVSGRYQFDGGIALVYKLGYVPSVDVHGYMNDNNMMTGQHIWNYRLAGEIPVSGNFKAVVGWHGSKAKLKAVFDDTDISMKFSGFFVGAKMEF